MSVQKQVTVSPVAASLTQQVARPAPALGVLSAPGQAPKASGTQSRASRESRALTQASRGPGSLQPHQPLPAGAEPQGSAGGALTFSSLERARE